MQLRSDRNSAETKIGYDLNVADIIRVWGWAWVMLQRGLVCIIKTSFQKASQPMKHCFLEGVGGI